MPKRKRAHDGGQGEHPQHDNPAVEQWRRHHLVYSVFFSLLFTVFDLFFVWPENHFWALLLVVCAISAVAWAELPWIFSLVASAAVLVIAGAIYVFAPPIIEKQPLAAGGGTVPPQPETEVIGALEPGSAPTPPNGCDHDYQDPTVFKVLIGDNAVAGAFGPITPLQIGACKVVTVDPKADGLRINADLYDESGNLVATIKDNTFHALSGPHSSVERQGDLSTLVVRDGIGNELLYVKYLNPNTVRIRGVFGCPGHIPVRVRDEEPIPGVHMSNSCGTGAVGFKIE